MSDYVKNAPTSRLIPWMKTLRTPEGENPIDTWIACQEIVHKWPNNRMQCKGGKLICDQGTLFCTQWQTPYCLFLLLFCFHIFIKNELI